MFQYRYSVATVVDEFDHLVLVDEIEDVRSVNEDTDRAGDDDRQEQVELEPIEY